MDKLHLSILSTWIILLIHDRLVAMTGMDLMVLPFVGLAVMMYGLTTVGKKETKSQGEGTN